MIFANESIGSCETSHGNEPIFETGGLRVDLVGRIVRLGNEQIQLTPTEYSLLKTFAVHANKVLTHRQLIREVWGDAHYEDTQHLLRVNV